MWTNSIKCRKRCSPKLRYSRTNPINLYFFLDWTNPKYFWGLFYHHSHLLSGRDSFVSSFTIEPSWIMLLRSDWMMVSQGTENSKVPPHEVSRCARVQLAICQWGKVESGTSDQLRSECVLHSRDRTHQSGVRPRAFWGHRGFSRGRSRNVRGAGRCCPVEGRVRVQREASESHIKPGWRHIYSLCFKLHWILIEKQSNFRLNMSNT